MKGVDLTDYYFPVRETKKIIIPKSEYDLIDPDNEEMAYTLEGYKAILREDTQQVISIASDKYELIENSQVIDPVLNSLEKTGEKFALDPYYSFCQNDRMKLAITFPEITLTDDKGFEAPLAIFIHNAYKPGKSAESQWGALRLVCKNGMTFASMLGSIFKQNHKGQFFMEDIQVELGKAIEKVPLLQQRITELTETAAESEDLWYEIEKKVGAGAAKTVTETPELIKGMQMWLIYNLLTQYIGHRISKQQQTAKQIAVSKIFNL